VKRTYLEKTPLEMARERWFAALEEAGFFQASVETVPAREAFGRVAAAELRARRPVPHVRASAMDGIAVRAADTAAARLDAPVVLREDEGYARVDTGDPLPQAWDAVVMLEALEFADDGAVELREAAFPGQNVRPVGEDFAQDTPLLPARTQITPEAAAACLAAGHTRLEVVRPPRAFVLPTGSELVSADTNPLPPDRYPETNSALFEGYLQRWGARPTLHPLVDDDEKTIRKTLEGAFEDHDLVLVNAGTSKGREDYAIDAIEALGHVLVHGVSMHPGHPVALGIAGGKPAVGVPGYPVATWVTLDQIVLPLLERLYGCSLQARRRRTGRLARKLTSHLGELDFVRVRLEETGDLPTVHPLTGKASALSSLVGADGVLEIPAELNGYDRGATVEVRLLR